VNNIERNTLLKVFSMLNACGVKYAIIDSDGKRHGNLRVEETKSRRELKYPFGTLSSHFVPIVKDMKPNEAVEINCKEYDPESMRSSLAAWASKNWGNGACTTMIDRNAKSIIVIRTPNDQSTLI